MSQYDETQTNMRVQEHLVAALKGMGFTVESHATAQVMHGDSNPKAEVIIRRCNLPRSQYADVGFARGEDGCFKAIISDVESWDHFNQCWVNQVKQAYRENVTMAMAREKGYVFQGRQEIKTERGQQVKLLFAVR